MPKPVDPTPFYRRIFVDALRVCINHTHLWVFGFFAAILGFGGVFEIFIKTYSKVADRITAGAAPIGWPEMVPGFASTIGAAIRYSPSPLVATVLLVAGGLLCLAVGIWLVCVAVGALIGSVRKIERGGSPHFSDGMKVGADNFWKILTLTVIVKVIGAVMMFLLIANLGAMLAKQSLLNDFVYVLSFALFSVLTVAVIIIGVFAACFVVVKGYGVLKALEEGWKLLNDNWLMSLEMLCVLLGTDLFIGFVSLVLLAALTAPTVFLFVVSTLAKWRSLMFLFTALTATAIAISAVIIGSFYTTLRTAIWTLFWVELVEKKRSPKIHRVVAAVKRLMGK